MNSHCSKVPGHRPALNQAVQLLHNQIINKSRSEVECRVLNGPTSLHAQFPIRQKNVEKKHHF